jgi:hypothetical protein
MNYKQIITNWVYEAKTDLIKNYSQNQRASGKWGETLTDEIKDTNIGFQIILSGQRYTGALIDGRLPNENQTPESIKAWVGWAGSTFIAQWVKDKGLTLNPYAVASNIATQGIKVPNAYNDGGILENVINTERLQLLGNSLGKMYMTTFISDLIDDLQ